MMPSSYKSTLKLRISPLLLGHHLGWSTRDLSLPLSASLLSPAGQPPIWASHCEIVSHVLLETAVMPDKCIVQCTLHTALYRTVYTSHCTLQYSAHCTLQYSAHCTLNSTVQWKLRTVLNRTVQCALHTELHSTVLTSHWTVQYSIHCILHWTVHAQSSAHLTVYCTGARCKAWREIC